MPRPPTKSSRVNMYLPDKLTSIGKRLAYRRGVTFSEITRTALREYLIREIELEKENG